MLKILHLAPQNFAGVPYSFYKMHNSCGDYSRLITLHRNPFSFPEDICLEYPLLDQGIFKSYRQTKVFNSQKTPEVKYWSPKMIERFYFGLRDTFRSVKIENLIMENNLNEFDIIHLDGGMDLYRDSRLVKKWKKLGKKIVCCYYGSDLRVRGVIKEIDEISDLNLTSEYDHLSMKEGLNYLFYPYDTSELPERKENQSEKIKIVHSPTNRMYKGTDLIIKVIEKLQKEKPIEFILLENMPRNAVLDIKSECDIAIDQVGGKLGGTGYGKAGLETLGMKIPTITNMTKEYSDWIPENPFCVANDEKELYKTLNELVDDAAYRAQKGTAGYNWLQKYHSYNAVNKKLKEYYKKSGII